MGFDLQSFSEATSGAIGALVSTTILYPLDTCKTKYQAEVRAHHQQKYSFFKRLYLEKSGKKSIGIRANLIVTVAAGACTVIVTQPLDTASSRMQTGKFGKSKGLWKSLSETTWSEAFDDLGISLLLTSNPSIQYTVFDQLKQRLLKRHLKRENGTESSHEALSAFSAFLLGALSKCVAMFLTYPAIRCKVMIQAVESDEDGMNQAPQNQASLRNQKTVTKRQSQVHSVSFGKKKVPWAFTKVYRYRS